MIPFPGLLCVCVYLMASGGDGGAIFMSEKYKEKTRVREILSLSECGDDAYLF